MAGGYKKLEEWQNENPEAALEAKREAGRKSVESKRKKKLLKEYLSLLLEGDGESGDLYTDITIALIKKAADGDVKAFHEIRDTLGQVEQNINVETGNTIKINITEDK